MAMRLIADSGYRMLRGSAHWQACALHDTARVDDLVMLAPAPAPVENGGPAGGFAGGYAGMAFDRRCRLFHPRPEDGSVDYVLWGQTSALGVHDNKLHPFVITAAGTEVDGSVTGELPKRPLALAGDAADYLYLADPDSQAVWLIDTWQQEVARRIDFAQPPLDLAACGGEVFVLLADGSTWQISACAAPERSVWPLLAGAQRLSVSAAARGGRLAWVLSNAGQFDATLHALHLGKSIAVPFCTDIVSEAEDTEFGTLMVVAQRPGENFLRLRLLANQPTMLPPLMAPQYDGRGIALAPDCRIAYWTAQGLRHAAPARAQYRQHGTLFSFALDAEHDQTQWGRLVVEACIPAGTAIRFRAFTRDELEFDDPIDGIGLAGETPVLSQHTWDHYAGESQTLFRDPSQRPLRPAPADGFALYDAPLIVAPGRYLWLVFEFSGTRSKSPRLRSARVEYPGHDLLKKLPRTLWREAASRDFLFRYLMAPAAMLDEWQAVASERQRLLDARIAPEAALPWLASFLGLVIDPCWSPAVQRQMILEAATLFRTRGTLASLKRMVEILSGAEVVIIEHFRLRGGGVVGNPQVNASQAVLGVGYRVGGAIGGALGGALGEPRRQALATEQPVASAAVDDVQNFDDFAHRFTVSVVAALDARQLDCVRRLIEIHKPAHTDFTLCTASSGIRAGLGAHLGISSVIGKSAGFEQGLMGDAVLGAGYLLGRPEIDREAK
ncbi:phage tail protein [Accumulibacter sp.]|uniref:phage tail protein n=1 Tax=Accumulibacter sp. TaxID=2053492 RepID=UPI00260C0036|nr:phage tail protein [Accumulibacter sp.]